MQIEITNAWKIKRRRIIQCAAYCRVSDDGDRLQNSLEAQKKHYADLVPTMQDCVLIGIFSDEAYSGTRADRPGLRKLITLCETGCVDRIIVKSISRLSRNTVDLLTITRHLSRINVDIFFEKENLHTLSNQSEVIMTLLASFAQEESRSISENIKWGIRKGFEQGKRPHYRLYGYRCVGNQYEIIPEQASVIRDLYTSLLSGTSVWDLVQDLNAKKIPGPKGRLFCEATVQRILANPSYTGTALLQREYIDNHITHKRKTNTGQLPMYEISNTFPQIIEPNLFKAVQDELHRRKAAGRSTNKQQHSWYTEKIVCGECGRTFRFLHRVGRTSVFCCKSVNRKGRRCPARRIPQATLFTVLNTSLGLSLRTIDDFAKAIEKITVCKDRLTILTTSGRCRECLI